MTSQVVLVVTNPPTKAGEVKHTGSVPGSGRSPGEGNGNPLQCSCLENPMDGGAWWATVHRVTESQAWLATNLSCIIKQGNEMPITPQQNFRVVTVITASTSCSFSQAQEAAILLPARVKTSLMTQTVKNLTLMQETQVQSLGQKDHMEKGIAAHFQYSYLENSMDRGTWPATIHGVTKRRRELRD